MAANLDNFQALLLGMRERFLDELPDRCNSLDNLILALEKEPDNQEIFDELYRGVHSLKGSGGTHGLPVITTICHHLENLLTEASSQHNLDGAFTNRALAFVDLLRQTEAPGRGIHPDYSAVEKKLEMLRQSGLQSRKSGLIAESSSTMSTLYRQALGGLPVKLVTVGNGLVALERLVHEPFDFVVVGRELKELNGIALTTALRASQTANRDIPVVLITSKHDEIPAFARFSAVLARDKSLADNLVAAIGSMLH